jgi:hypothetical protein
MVKKIQAFISNEMFETHHVCNVEKKIKQKKIVILTCLVVLMFVHQKGCTYSFFSICIYICIFINTTIKFFRERDLFN